MFKRIISISLFTAIFTSLFIAPSNAVLPISCVFDQPRPVSQTTIETYAQWLKRQKLQLNNNSCFTDSKATQSIYNSLAKKVLLDLQSKDKNEFNKRYDACTKGQSVTLSPKSWFTSMKCLFTTSFFPTTDVLKVKFNQLMNDFKSHQPTSYIPIALGVITNIKNNWGGVDCTTGSISANVPLVGQQSGSSLNYVIPCKPPSALGALRSLMVLAVWIGFAFWLYRTGSNFWKEKSA